MRRDGRRKLVSKPDNLNHHYRDKYVRQLFPRGLHSKERCSSTTIMAVIKLAYLLKCLKLISISALWNMERISSNGRVAFDSRLRNYSNRLEAAPTMIVTRKRCLLKRKFIFNEDKFKNISRVNYQNDFGKDSFLTKQNLVQI